MPAVKASLASKADLGEILDLIVGERVGGTYWGAQPQLPDAGYALVSIFDPDVRRRILEELPAGRSFHCVDRTQDADPWHLIGGASEVIVDAEDERARQRRGDDGDAGVPGAVERLYFSR